MDGVAVRGRVRGRVPGHVVRPVPAGPVPELEPGTLVRVVGTIATGRCDRTCRSSDGGPSDSSFIDGMPAGPCCRVVEGPVADDGLDWYRLTTGRSSAGPSPGQMVGRSSRSLSLHARRPTRPTVEDVVYLSALVRRVCFGDRELALRTQPVRAAGRTLAATSPLGEPAWLAHPVPYSALFGIGGTNGIDAGLPAVLAPGVERPAARDWVTVRGHFNDPAVDDLLVDLPGLRGTARADAAGGPAPPVRGDLRDHLDRAGGRAVIGFRARPDSGRRRLGTTLAALVAAHRDLHARRRPAAPVAGGAADQPAGAGSIGDISWK